MVDILTDILTDAGNLAKLFAGVAAVWFTAWTWIRTRSIVPTLSSMLLGAVVVWGVTHYESLQGEVGEDVERYSVEGG